MAMPGAGQRRPCSDRAGYAPCMEWTPSRIRLFRRTGLCLSQPEFARALGFARRTVGNAERGANPPSLALRRALDVQLEGASEVPRNRFFAALATEPGIAPHPDHLSPVAESVELLRQSEASDLGADSLDQLEQLVERLGYDYFAMSPAAFRGTLLSWRRYVARLLDGRVTLSQRRRLYAVAGWLSGLLAEVSLALGEAAEPHCVTALSLAREVGDPRLAGWVLGTRAQIALYTGNPLHSVAFARAARQISPRGSAVLFRSFVLEGRAHARRADPAASESAFAGAEQAVAERLDSRPGSFWSFDSPYLPYYCGTAYLWLGKPNHARARATEAIALCDASPWALPVARTSARVDLACALISLGERAEAATVGTDAVTIWCERPTYPAKRRINDLITLLQPFQDPTSRELKEQWSWIST